MLQGRHLVTPRRGQLTLPPAYPRKRGHVMADPATPFVYTWTS